ncbi:hypothetical protein ACFLXH_02560 [Chloroflexota bacterium]
MVINNSFEEQLRKLLSETQDELNKINTQIKNLEERKDALSEELRSYDFSLHSYLKRVGKQVEESKPSDWAEILKGLQTHKQRLLAIAQHNEGKLKLNSAVDIIYNGNYIRSRTRHNAYVQLYQIAMDMVDKKELVKIEPGMFGIGNREKLF